MTTGQQVWNVTLTAPLAQFPGRAEFGRVVSGLGGRVVSSPAILPTASVQLPAGADANQLLSVPGVLSVEPDRLAGAEQLTAPLSRPVPLSGPSAQAISDFTWPLRMVKGDQAQAQGFSGDGVRVAVLDTGINTAHEEFQGVEFIASESFVDGAPPEDDHGHGTAVAGMVAAQGVQVRGVAPGAQIANLRVMDAEGFTSTSILLAGLDRAAALDCQVVNLSLGFLDRFDPVPSMEAALKALAENGIICVAAAGNEGFTDALPMPGGSRYTIAAGAVSQDSIIPSWSNSAPWPDSPECIAPGEDVPVVWYEGGYATVSGTSIACPMVAGAVALFLSAGAVRGSGALADCPKYQEELPEGMVTARLALRGSGVVLENAIINQQGYGLVDTLAGALSEPVVDGPTPTGGLDPVTSVMASLVVAERSLAQVLFAPLLLFSPNFVPPPGPLETLFPIQVD